MLGKPCEKCGQLLTESNYFEIPKKNNRKRYFFLFGKIPDKHRFGIGPNCNDCTWPWHLLQSVEFAGGG